MSVKVPSTLGAYSVEACIGAGAFSSVYKVSRDDKLFALKVISRNGISESGAKKRLESEIATMKKLSHSNLVRLVDNFEDRENFYLVMDYCPGGTLSEFIHSGPKIRETTAAIIFQQIVRAVQYCHLQGVAHRDLKPENILITRAPTIKITDFGLCGDLTGDQKMTTFCGTPCYAAPECLLKKKYGIATDIWSLGVILFELVTGKYPWPVKNTPQMLKQILHGQYETPTDVSMQCCDLIRSMLRVNPSNRMTLDAILEHEWFRFAGKGIERKKLVTIPVFRAVPIKTENAEARNKLAKVRSANLLLNGSISCRYQSKPLLTPTF